MITTSFQEPIEQGNSPVYEQIIDDLARQNYSVCDTLFAASDIQKLRQALLNKYEADQFRQAAIGDKSRALVEGRIRNDAIFWLDETITVPCEQRFFSVMDDLIAYLNRTCFTGIRQRNFHYAVYPEGHFYKRHLDVFKGDNSRKLSVVCYLNDASWQAENGGELVLYPRIDGREVSVFVQPLPGRLLIFDSQQLPHEVKPVKRGSRYSLTGWLRTR